MPAACVEAAFVAPLAAPRLVPDTLPPLLCATLVVELRVVANAYRVWAGLPHARLVIGDLAVLLALALPFLLNRIIQQIPDLAVPLRKLSIPRWGPFPNLV